MATRVGVAGVMVLLSVGAAPQAVAAPAPAVVSEVTAAQLGTSWRPGCPLEPEQLRRVELDHLGFDNQIHRGEIIVHQAVVDETIEIFADLLDMGFPIQKMRNVANYPNSDDQLVMEDNNTSAFNCRDIPGSGSWSHHAYGRAIDINPRLNPFIPRSGPFEPRNAEVFLDRDRIDPGLLKADDAAVRAFTDRGWRWGGYWSTPIDYQHFERPAS